MFVSGDNGPCNLGFPEHQDLHPGGPVPHDEGWCHHPCHTLAPGLEVEDDFARLKLFVIKADALAGTVLHSTQVETT